MRRPQGDSRQRYPSQVRWEGPCGEKKQKKKKPKGIGRGLGNLHRDGGKVVLSSPAITACLCEVYAGQLASVRCGGPAARLGSERPARACPSSPVLFLSGTATRSSSSPNSEP